MGVLIEMLFDYIREKIVSRSNDDQFEDVLLKIFETKIFPVHKINFMQYLPIYVIALAKESA